MPSPAPSRIFSHPPARQGPRRAGARRSGEASTRLSADRPGAGGFTDLLDRLRKAGLSDQVASWVGGGSNKPIDPGQVTRAIGQQQLTDMASRAGISPARRPHGLAKALPEVVNR